MNANSSTATPEVNPWLVALVVSMATFMEVLDTTITNVSISHIAGTLGASQDESTWVLTSYLVANGIVLPISGWLANTLGRKKFFLICIGSFTAASFACGAATSLEMLVFFRLVQGLAGGGLQPTQQSIILDAFPPEKRGAVFGITGITLIAAPIIGPTLGGWLTDNYSWRWVFFINIPVGILAMVLVARLVHDPEHSRARGFKNIDYIGLSLIALGLGALQIMLDKGQQKDWFDSSLIVALFLFSASCLIFAVFWLLKQEDPVVDLKLFGTRTFGLSSILIFFTGFALYGGSVLLPLLLQTNFGYDATTAGLVLSPSGFVVMFLMPVSGKLVSKFQARYLVGIGLCLSAIGMWLTSHVTPQTDYNHFVLMRLFQVVGLPFLFIPVSTLAFAKISKEKNNKASALFSLCRNLGGSFGIAVITAFLARHQQIHQNAMAANLEPSSPTYQAAFDSVRQAFLNTGATFADATKLATGRIYQELLKQSSIMSYHDGFLLLSGVMLSGLVLVFFMPSNKPKASAADAPVH